MNDIAINEFKKMELKQTPLTKLKQIMSSLININNIFSLFSSKNEI